MDDKLFSISLVFKAFPPRPIFIHLTHQYMHGGNFTFDKLTRPSKPEPFSHKRQKNKLMRKMSLCLPTAKDILNEENV